MNKKRKMDMDDIKTILFGRSDDTIFYKIIIPFVFKEFKSFEVRHDIEIPLDDFEGTILSFNNGKFGYFKIQSQDLNDEEFKTILKVCEFIKEKYESEVESYILCEPEIDLKEFSGCENKDIPLNVRSLKNYDGDAVVEMLENKRKNKEKFTFHDHVCHILLPYMGYEDKNEFLPKYQHYMMETMLDNAEKHGIEVVRLD